VSRFPNSAVILYIKSSKILGLASLQVKNPSNVSTKSDAPSDYTRSSIP